MKTKKILIVSAMIGAATLSLVGCTSTSIQQNSTPVASLPVAIPKTATNTKESFYTAQLLAPNFMKVFNAEGKSIAPNNSLAYYVNSVKLEANILVYEYSLCTDYYNGNIDKKNFSQGLRIISALNQEYIPDFSQVNVYNYQTIMHNGIKCFVDKKDGRYFYVSTKSVDQFEDAIKAYNAMGNANSVPEVLTDIEQFSISLQKAELYSTSNKPTNLKEITIENFNENWLLNNTQIPMMALQAGFNAAQGGN